MPNKRLQRLVFVLSMLLILSMFVPTFQARAINLSTEKPPTLVVYGPFTSAHVTDNAGRKDCVGHTGTVVGKKVDIWFTDGDVILERTPDGFSWTSGGIVHRKKERDAFWFQSIKHKNDGKRDVVHVTDVSVCYEGQDKVGVYANHIIDVETGFDYLSTVTDVSSTFVCGGDKLDGVALNFKRNQVSAYFYRSGKVDLSIYEFTKDGRKLIESKTISLNKDAVVTYTEAGGSQKNYRIKNCGSYLILKY